jgi:DHA1 family bicyclomycin/chloramphenicol resistance-like MFS transporter
VVAPSLGSAILRFGSWRAIFVVLAAVSATVVLISWRFLPETLPPAARRPVGLASMAGVVSGLVRDRVFVGLVLASGCSFGAVIAYVSGSPFVLQDGFGLSVQQFGVAFSAGAVGMVAMTQVNVPLLRRFEPGRLLLTGIIGCLVSTAVLVGTALTGTGGLFGVLVPIWSAMAFLALTFPNTPAIALSRHGEAAGTASAVMGASQNLVAAAAAPLVGLLGSSALSLGLVMFGCFAAALTLLLVVVRPQGLKLPADLMRNDRTPVSSH